MSRVRFAARDPGAANVLAGFLRQWTPAKSLQVDVWTLPRATAKFANARAEVLEFGDGLHPGALLRAWEEKPARVLVTGTSHYVPFESTLWTMARQRGCPTLAVIDQWTNLSRRFCAGRPDAIGAIDEFQVRELRELGFSPAEIIVVGHPALSELARQQPSIRTTLPQARGEANVNVLFVSEPIAEDVRNGSNAPYGFDEFDSFTVLYEGACRAVDSGGRVCLAVKFHPYENPGPFLERAGALPARPGLTVRYLRGDASPHHWVRWSDLVVGISSMLLLEAMVLGKAVVSLQPGLVREETFVASRRGYAQTITDYEEGRKVIAALVTSAKERERIRLSHLAFLQTITHDAVGSIANWIRVNLAGSEDSV